MSLMAWSIIRASFMTQLAILGILLGLAAVVASFTTVWLPDRSGLRSAEGAISGLARVSDVDWRRGTQLFPVSTNGTDLRLRFKEDLGFVVVTKERR